MKINIDTRNMNSAIEKYAAAAGISVKESAEYAARVFVQNVVRVMPPAAIYKGTLAQARRRHTAFLVKRIKEQRRKRRGRGYLSKEEIPGYLKNAKAWQGELAASWNAAATMLKAKGVPKYVSRHGEKHGHAKEETSPTTALITISYEGENKNRNREEFDYFVKQAMNKTRNGLNKAVEQIIKRRFKKSVKSY